MLLERLHILVESGRSQCVRGDTLLVRNRPGSRGFVGERDRLGILPLLFGKRVDGDLESFDLFLMLRCRCGCLFLFLRDPCHNFGLLSILVRRCLDGVRPLSWR